MKNRLLSALMGSIGMAVFIAGLAAGWSARPAMGQTASVGNDDIGGVVTSAKGPEAGVWVIAETSDLPTKYVKIVVTDDRGRYLAPGLPKANYSVWVRGYGLVDSAKVQAAPGSNLNLKAVVAPNPRAAADFYPANYWLSLLRPPDKSEFPGTGTNGNGISENMKVQGQWIRLLKTDACMACHQLGNKATREIEPSLGKFDSSVAAWTRRVQSGQAGGPMIERFNRIGMRRAIAVFADWTDRVKAGELPPTPPRPQGMERNVVITMWDWADPKGYLHDEISTDRRNPTVNANGLIYGSMEESEDYLPVLDPVHHTATQVKVPVRDPNTPSTKAAPVNKPMMPSPYWGAEILWDSKGTVHTPALDDKGRVWITSRVRPPANPAYCKEGSNHPSAKLFPLDESDRQLAMYDPKTKKFTLIDTCFKTHHLQFAEDANHTLWTTSDGTTPAIGWLNTKMFEETGDEQKSQGWAPLILDTNGNGRQDAWVEPDQPVDPAKDKRIAPGIYGIALSPVDGSAWGTQIGFPGAIVRMTLGPNPPTTALTELYEVPWNNPKAPVQGYGPRGLDIDRNGVVWTVIGSGHLASFDRRKCKGPLNGPTATGQHCPEGWTLNPLPGPQLKGVTDSGSAESAYYDWVDQFDTFGLGKNVPIANGSNSDSLLAFVNGKFLVFRVPYPMGFYSKGLDGRIDDPKAGWKGKGLWVTYGSRTPFHIEGGKGTAPKLVHFQLRPDPLAN